MMVDQAPAIPETAVRVPPVPRWRLLALFLRARGMLISTILVLAGCGLFPLLAEWAGRAAMRQALLLQLVPVIVAALIGVSVWSPFGEPERTAARSLPMLRAMHVGSLLLASNGLSMWLVSRWTQQAPEVELHWVVVRNIVGLAGLVLLAGRLIDARLSWIAPLVTGILASSYILRVRPSELDTMWDPAWWLWSGQSSDDVLSWVIALTLGVGGFTWFCRSGPRDASGEEMEGARI